MVKPLSSKQKKLFLIAGIFFILLLFFLWGWIPYLINKHKTEALARDPQPIHAQTLHVKPITEPTELVLPSSSQAWHITPLWARINGYISQFLVDIGDVVKKGDLLAIIETPEVDEQVKQTQAELLDSIYLRDIAKITSDRWQNLWNRDVEAVTKQEVDQNLANYKSAQAIVEANEKNVARLVATQQFKFIYAPFDGIIIQRTIDLGSLIYGNINETPQELFQIAEINTLRFFVDVPQTYYRQIKEGLEVEVFIPQFPDKKFKGVVTRYAKALDPTARTLLTQVDVENKEWILLSGLFAQVKFLMQPEKNSYMIPTTALIIRTSYPMVAVVNADGTVHLKEVRIGLDYGNHVQIISGLEENDQIITIPSDWIREGVKVVSESQSVL